MFEELELAKYRVIIKNPAQSTAGPWGVQINGEHNILSHMKTIMFDCTPTILLLKLDHINSYWRIC